MAKPLVIVESPAKAKTIAGYLGRDYVVESSIGHIRDLPRNASDVPAAFKGEPWARLGVDVDNDFKALYVVSKERREQVAKLKRLLSDASELYLATDEDREGESIAWHLVEVLSPRVPVHRMVFHEITPAAISAAVASPRELDRRLVDAQEARRILDRLYGYEVSPVLWKKVATGLSAGRVQSVATRIVVERERERMAFRSASWWGIVGDFAAGGQGFAARLVDVGGQAVATGDDFGPDGRLSNPGDVVLLDEPAASGLAAALGEAPFRVASVEERPYRRSPAAPFMTSTLQQEAARKLRYSAQRTMRLAQALYERGYITYMRTDSTTLSDMAVQAARQQAAALYGASSVPAAPRTYRNKVKNAQEAHEAIRPAGDRFRQPSSVARGALRRRAAPLRARVAAYGRLSDDRCHRDDGPRASGGDHAGGVALAGRSAGSPAGGHGGGHVGDGDGHHGSRLLAGVPGGRRRDGGLEGERRGRPPAQAVGGARGRVRGAHDREPRHATPARYTEASLVRRLEELGVGRPSTYASILQTILDRNYVWRKGTALVPSFTAFAVVNLMEQHFPSLVDYGFTASMENDLDEIASGTEESVPWLERFYFGESHHLPGPEAGRGRQPRHALAVDGKRGLKDAVLTHLGEIDAREVNSIPIGADPDGEEIVVRVGRYGPYLQRGETRAAVPEDLAPDELTVERALELLSKPSGDRVVGTDPESGKIVLARAGRYGPYVQLDEAEEGSKPLRTASLFASMSLETITLEEALRLLALPRVVGVDPATGHEIVARNGRYGPYLEKGTETRSLDNEEQLFTISHEQALARFAQPKQRRYGVTAAPLRELGPDPVSGGPIVLRSGRFGPYVTDGTVNASLRRADDPDTITLDRAAELIAARRETGPSSRGGGRRGAKKAAAKKPVARKAAAKKATAKQTVPRKATAKKATTKNAATKKAGTKKAGTKKAGTKKAGTKKAGVVEKLTANGVGGMQKATASKPAEDADGANP